MLKVNAEKWSYVKPFQENSTSIHKLFSFSNISSANTVLKPWVTTEENARPCVVKGNLGLYLSPVYVCWLSILPYILVIPAYGDSAERKLMSSWDKGTPSTVFGRHPAGRMSSWDWCTQSKFLQCGLHYSMFRRRMGCTLSWQKHCVFCLWAAPVLQNLPSYQPGKSRLIYLIFSVQSL